MNPDAVTVTTSPGINDDGVTKTEPIANKSANSPPASSKYFIIPPAPVGAIIEVEKSLNSTSSPPSTSMDA